MPEQRSFPRNERFLTLKTARIRKLSPSPGGKILATPWLCAHRGGGINKDDVNEFYFLHAGVPVNDILELFGGFFVEFCQESGYDRILQVLGGNTKDFLQVCHRFSRRLTNGSRQYQ